MNNSFNIPMHRSSELMLPILVFLVTMLCGYLIRMFVFRKLTRLAIKNKRQIDCILIAAIKGPFIIWAMMLGIYFALKSTQLHSHAVVIGINKTLLVLGIISVTMVMADVTARIIKNYSVRLDSSVPVTSLTQNIGRIVIFIIGALIVMNTLGVSITPILATLGVGGLAVALALQETLSNLFAGFHIIISKQVRVGDYVRLESGEEGYVIDINWRSTQIRMLPNNVVLVPNLKMIQTIITNYNLPEKELAVLVEADVHFSSDLAKVERVTCEVAKEVLKRVQGGVADFEPFIRYHTFGDFSIKFSVILRGKEFVDQYLIKHEFIKALHERYSMEGIVIPCPVRAVNYIQEKERVL